MPHQIIIQPNGKLALWSDELAYFCLYDADEEEVTDFLVELPRPAIRNTTARTIERLRMGDDVYGERTVGWDDALAEAKEAHKGSMDEEIAKIEEDGNVTS